MITPVYSNCAKAIQIFLITFCLFSFSFTHLALGAESAKEEVKVLVGFSAGDTLDVLIRVLAAEVNKKNIFQVIIENVPGAGGINAVTQVANNKSNNLVLGSTVSNAFLLMPHKNQVPYKPLADLIPVLIFGQASPIIFTLPDSPYKEFADLIKAGDKNISFALSGLGTPTHIALEEAAKKDNVNWKYIPFTGAGEVEVALMGKHADIGATGALGRIAEGQFHPLAILGGNRLAALPDVPTFKELGYSDAGLQDTYFMLFASSTVPTETVKALEKAFSEAINTEEYKNALKLYSVSSIIMNAEESKNFLEKAWDKETILLKSLGIIQAPATSPR